MGFVEITRKDLRLLVRDRRALFILLVLPMAFIAILGLTTGRLLGWKDENQLLSLAVVDDGGTPLSQAVVTQLDRLDGVSIRPFDSLEAADSAVRKGDVTLAVQIGADFPSRAQKLGAADVIDVSSGTVKFELADVGIQIHGRPSAAMVRSVVEQLVLFSTLRAILPEQMRRMLPPDVESADSASSRDNPPRDLTSEDSDTGNSDEVQKPGGSPVYQTLVPSYTVMFAFFLVNIMARSFIAERELGTLRRLRIAPITTVDLLAGKTLPFLAISLIQSSTLFLFGRLLFGMAWGAQPWMLVPIVFSTSLAATGMGLLVATIVRTDSQVSAYANFLVITLAGISGCFMPRDWLPETMQRISLVTPHAWSLTAFDEALSNPDPQFSVIIRASGVLTAFAAAFFAAGCLRFGSYRE